MLYIELNIVFSKMAVLLIVFHGSYGKYARRLRNYRIKQGHKVRLVRYRKRLNIRKVVQRVGANYVILMGSIEEVPSVMRSINETWAKSTFNQKVRKAASDISYGVIGGKLQAIVGRLSPGDNVYRQSGRELNKKEKRRNIDNQIRKIIAYERGGNDVGSSGKRRVAGIGSNEGDGYGIDGMSDKVFLHSELERMYKENGVVYNEFFDGGQVGGGSDGIDDGVVLDKVGNPSDRSIKKVMNEGGGIKALFYTGHANEISLSTSGFDIGDVSGLVQKRSGGNLFIGCAVGCSVGSHDENYMSLSEALQCARYCGSVAFFGSTILQSWTPPMYMQREIMRKFSVAKSVGELFRTGVEVENFRTADDFWFYTLFGDPMTVMR